MSSGECVQSRSRRTGAWPNCEPIRLRWRGCFTWRGFWMMPCCCVKRPTSFPACFLPKFWGRGICIRPHRKTLWKSLCCSLRWLRCLVRRGKPTMPRPMRFWMGWLGCVEKITCPHFASIGDRGPMWEPRQNAKSKTEATWRVWNPFGGTWPGGVAIRVGFIQFRGSPSGGG